jgi:hypothetical protein
MRGFPRQLRSHLQFDVLRVKYTNWDVLGGSASSWTFSTGYQRLSPDVWWLTLWLLGGYEVAGDRHGPVTKVGAEIHFAAAHGVVELGPAFDEHLELDPRMATFARVYQGRLYVHHKIGFVRWGVAYEAAAIEHGSRLQGLTPELELSYRGFSLGLRYRFSVLRDVTIPGAPQDRFNLSLDRLF